MSYLSCVQYAQILYFFYTMHVILSPGSGSFDTLNCSAIQNDYRFRSLKARAAHLIICLP